MLVSYFKDKVWANGFYSDYIKCLKGKDFSLNWVFVPHTRDRAWLPGAAMPYLGSGLNLGSGNLDVSPAPPLAFH